jgi:hypothetical protein
MYINESIHSWASKIIYSSLATLSNEEPNEVDIGILLLRTKTREA